MNQDFSELVEYLDKKFEQTAAKQGIETLQTSVAVLHEGVREVKINLTELQGTVRDLVNAIDKLAKVINKNPYGELFLSVGVRPSERVLWGSKRRTRFPISTSHFLCPGGCVFRFLSSP
ncbi:MAG: hypothetical protein HYY99_00425 [Candidatus Colwellbacteria bacterium]|nr:hypothetical protein [Candidatus Colwellbacteria bacterium]MBI3088717.1 hypothetical protein [Candidatus Colwellbacteria bacterium]